ncbi:MAG: hypothetical protein U0521_01260 [Anaerolineae bacterium]
MLDAEPAQRHSAHGLYVYGTLPLFIVKEAAQIVVSGSEWIAHNILANNDPGYASYSGGQWATYDGIHLIWRFLSALSEMGVILICFLIGAKLHDRWIGLLAALYAVTVFSIQMAHFGTVDAPANLFSGAGDPVRRAGAARGQAAELRPVRRLFRLRGGEPHQSRAAGGAGRHRWLPAK